MMAEDTGHLLVANSSTLERTREIIKLASKMSVFVCGVWFRNVTVYAKL